MRENKEFLESFFLSVGGDTTAIARLKRAPDEATFFGILGEIARERGYVLTDEDVRGIYRERAAVPGELSDGQLESVAGGRDRRKAGLDNIQKFLDIIHGMNVHV